MSYATYEVGTNKILLFFLITFYKVINPYTSGI